MHTSALEASEPDSILASKSGPHGGLCREEDEVVGVGPPVNQQLQGGARGQASHGGQHHLGACRQRPQLLPTVADLHMPAPTKHAATSMKKDKPVMGT